MNISVFCSAHNVHHNYVSHASEFAEKLAKRGHNLVFGASNTGLMQVVAETASKNGAKVIGISLPSFEKTIRPHLDELIVAKSLAERKEQMLDKSDAVAMLIGGAGTLDEITDVIELKIIGVHNKPMVIVNHDNFYKGLLEQLQCMHRQGFIKSELDDIIYFAKGVDDALDYLEGKTLKH